MRILFVVPYLPSLIRVRPYNLIHALAQRDHQITLLALHPAGDDSSGLADLQSWCQRVCVIPLSRWRPLWNGLRALATRVPFQAAYSRSPRMTRLVQKTLAEDHYDVIHLEHLRGAELCRDVDVADVPVVFDAVDSISLLFERAMLHAARWQSRVMARLDLERTRRYEGQFTRRFSRVLVTSPEDYDALVALSLRRSKQVAPEGRRRLIVLPNGVDLGYFRPLGVERQSEAVVYTGKMSYHANTAAALDLVRTVMPTVWARRPQTQVWIVGKDPPNVVRELALDPRVTVTGTVPDIRPYLARATVAVTPLRYSVGIQNKVLEAMAMGTPVVTTPSACRALMVEPNTHLVVGDSAEALANAIQTLLADKERRRQLSQAGRRYVEAYHDWDRIVGRLESIYQEVKGDATLPEPPFQ